MLSFDQNGFLIPYAPILTNLDTLERVFVEEFDASVSRRNHFERYRDFNARLRTYLPAGIKQWIDGSFISRKVNPNDIDVLTFVDYTLYVQHEKALRALKQEFASGAGGKVDAYMIQVFPEGHQYQNFYESDRVQWLYDWSRTARLPRCNKGFIELITG